MLTWRWLDHDNAYNLYYVINAHLPAAHASMHCVNTLDYSLSYGRGKLLLLYGCVFDLPVFPKLCFMHVTCFLCNLLLGKANLESYACDA